MELPDVEALVRHGGMSTDAAALATGEKNLFEFGPRRGPLLGSEFRGAVLIGGTPETLDAGNLPVGGPTEALGAIHKVSAIVLPTDDQVQAVKTGAPVIVQKLER
jgi:hypothetical protein